MSAVATKDLRAQLKEAQEAILATLKQDEDRWWSATELREAVQNGWASTVVSAAIQSLIASGVIETNGRLHLHLKN